VPDTFDNPYTALASRWSGLSGLDRDRHARRLVGVGLAQVGIDRPEPNTSSHYRRLLVAARADDEIAFAWLASNHRPLLLLRGRALHATDPAEWGAAALEVLHTVIHHIELTDSRWLRSTVTQRLAKQMDRRVRTHLRHRRHEQLLDPRLLHLHTPPAPAHDADEHPELSAVLATLLGRLDAATRDGLIALAERDSLHQIATTHALTDTALRQRITRARHHLQPRLAAYRRTVA
jgi:hypothetical protein